MMTSFSQKTFLLGLGAQKAGTSWLADYLEGRPDTDMGFRKEYHVFDFCELDTFQRQRDQAARRVENTISEGFESWKGNTIVSRLAFMADYRIYFAYFADLLRTEGVAVTGDITPAYPGLSVDTYRMIRREFAARSIRVAPVFLMRDPVDRLYSALRMGRRKANRRTTVEEDIPLLRVLVRADKSELRGNYRRTIENMDAVFGSDSFIHFYEELFDETVIRDLCAFLGLPFVPADFDKRVNASESAHVLPAAVRLELAENYRDSFAFLAERFGAARLARIWPSFAMIESR